MCEVTVDNFEDILPNFEQKSKSAKFIAIDSEFSALNTSEKLTPSLFDSASERYAKMRSNIELMSPVQIGITLFDFDADNNRYKAEIFTFYIFPISFYILNKKFMCEASSLQFLCVHKFDFNKWVYKGIPYLNIKEESQFRKDIKELSLEKLQNRQSILEDIIQDQMEIVTSWFYSPESTPELFLKADYSFCVVYFLQKHIRNKIVTVWTEIRDGKLIITKVHPNKLEELKKSCSLDEDFIKYATGFAKVFHILVTSQKPIIGHNLFTDLMLMIHHFHEPLPKSYASFKKLIHSLFPKIYDTKCISFDVKGEIEEKKRWCKNTLPDLYHYFKGGYGRHLASNSPMIEPINSSDKNLDFHNAGWDSYCTGYIFIRMAHFLAYKQYSVKNKIFMSSELFHAVSQYKNSVNIIRGVLSHVQLDGEDPLSRRPSWLVAETNKNKPININEIASVLSAYGFVEVKPSTRYTAIVAVDNFGSARRILNNFKSHSDFSIQQYSILRHSVMVKRVFMGSFVASGVLLMLYGLSKYR